MLRTAKDGLPAGEDDSSNEKFGSLHPGVCNFVFLDGHVQSIATEFDVVMLQHLSAIGDGNVVSAEL